MTVLTRLEAWKERGTISPEQYTLLEGLSLWHQRPLSVVLSADVLDDGSALGLCDALGFGRALHYEVAVAVGERRGRRRRRELRGLGDFRDLRQLALWEVAR